MGNPPKFVQSLDFDVFGFAETNSLERLYHWFGDFDQFTLEFLEKSVVVDFLLIP